MNQLQLSESNNKPFVLFKKNKETFYLFQNPLQILILEEKTTLDDFFYQWENALDNGKWVAGYFTYEAGYLLDNYFNHSINSFIKKQNDHPLAWLGVFEKPEEITDKNDFFEVIYSLYSDNREFINYHVENFHFSVDQKEYCKNVGKIRELIAQGTLYQLNYGFKVSFRFQGEPLFLFQDLLNQQESEYAGYIDTGNRKIISLSPELFFKKKGNTLTVKPMKGTIKRGDTSERDRENYNILKNSEKDRAENVMIVDLLRNDLGKISRTESVHVESLFDIEEYKTVYQMTSTISSEIKSEVCFQEIFSSLFPSGSITGAPKLKTMEWINRLEQERRGIFCGSIGYVTSSRDARFNVAIRTLEIDQMGTGELGIGSGITYDSDPEKEYEECLLKAKFFTEQDYHLIETILWDSHHQEFFLNELHLKRMKKSANELGFPYSERDIIERLESVSLKRAENAKIRLLLHRSGQIDVSVETIKSDNNKKRIKFSRFQTNAQDFYLQHKTSRRNLYEIELIQARKEGYYDVIFCNNDNEITEGSFNNVIIQKGTNFYTPPVKCGLLPGVYREYVINHPVLAYPVIEKVLYLPDILKAEAVFLINSVRGIIRVSV